MVHVHRYKRQDGTSVRQHERGAPEAGLPFSQKDMRGLRRRKAPSLPSADSFSSMMMPPIEGDAKITISIKKVRKH